MKNKYYIYNLKSDLNIDDCVDFLSHLPLDNLKEKPPLRIALPLSRLSEMSEKFSHPSLKFGSAELGAVEENSFTETIAIKLVQRAQGRFVLIGTPEERKAALTTSSHLIKKINKALESELEVVYYMPSLNAEFLTEELSQIAESEFAKREKRAIIVCELPLDQLESYLPTKEEIKKYYDLFSGKMTEFFKEDSSSIDLVVKLPSDLIGFSAPLEGSLFAGAFFSKPGRLPHALHQETLSLFNVSSEVDENGERKYGEASQP